VRLWSLHPKYLDPQGLVAVWREALLAQAVLRGRTSGYRSHPQLARFRAEAASLSAINSYLAGIYTEAAVRGYVFDRRKIGRIRTATTIPVTSGQVEHEWRHLMSKLRARNPALHERWSVEHSPECHALFRVCAGKIETWERI
jgi:hypothetical protein